MSTETDIQTKTNIIFVEAKPYSYITTSLGLIDKIFSESELDNVKEIAKKLAISAVEEKMLLKEITIGAEAFGDPNACTNRLIRESEFGVKDNRAWQTLQDLLTHTNKPQDMLLSLNSLGVIDTNTDRWEILRNLEEIHNSKKN